MRIEALGYQYAASHRVREQTDRRLQDARAVRGRILRVISPSTTTLPPRSPSTTTMPSRSRSDPTLGPRRDAGAENTPGLFEES